jgi:hypothetical protein
MLELVYNLTVSRLGLRIIQDIRAWMGGGYDFVHFGIFTEQSPILDDSEQARYLRSGSPLVNEIPTVISLHLVVATQE